MNPYEHRVPITKARADDVNRHYVIGRWLMAVLANDEATEKLAAATAHELGVNIEQLRRLIK